MLCETRFELKGGLWRSVCFEMEVPGSRLTMRLWRRMEAAWDQLEGSFTYIRIELTSIAIERS